MNRSGTSPADRDPLHRLLEHGQSYWLDNLTRDKLRTGELKRRVMEEGLRGVTSNPAIFHKAIEGNAAYLGQIRTLSREGLDPYEIYEHVVLDDVRDACDVLRPVYDASDGLDGFVSLELSPHRAYDTRGSMRDARRLFGLVDRPNVLIKIPGTPAGTPAIEQMLYEGVNVNVTLLFSIPAYQAVAEAYMRALERRREEGSDVEHVSSVASFFISRIDVLVDHLLGQRMAGDDGPRAARLLGRIGVANAKVAYRRFQGLLESDRWRRLQEAGARPQRLLWASTSTKDPLYGDVRYVEPLIGPHTVNTMPDATIAAFADHGRVSRTVDEGAEEAAATLETLAEVGIDLDRVTWQLMNEGVQKFVEPFDRLLVALSDERHRTLGDPNRRGTLLGERDRATVDDVIEALVTRRLGQRLHAGDAGLWTDDEAKAREIRHRLGWLSAGSAYRERVAELTAFAREVAEEGIEDVVLLGMGGSSLTGDVSARLFGSLVGHPSLLTLDDTDPVAIRAVRDVIEPRGTLFLVASKSGTTTETISLYRWFYQWMEERLGEEAPRHFAAITDPGSPLAEEARTHGFRRIFENDPDIGGRYSALSYFGLVPMALQGAPLEEMLASAARMRASCGPHVPERADPGVELGAVLAVMQRGGRDKVTFALSDDLAPFGDWVEQLLAESLGKDGTGLVPVVGETLGSPESYGDDRVFVHIRTADEPDPANTQPLEELEHAGHPVVRLLVDGAAGLGAEFFRWEVATATIGAVLHVNAFDQPNVESAKERTRRILAGEDDDEWRKDPSGPITVEGDRIKLIAFGRPERLQGGGPAEALDALLRGARGGDYLALLPYLARTEARREHLDRIRTALRNRYRFATTLGYGPRYLHSTGQLHKGGPDSGIFVVITAEEEDNLPIPGVAYGFSALHRAQAMGDIGALRDAGRRVVQLHLAGNVEEELAHLSRALRSDAAPLVTT